MTLRFADPALELAVAAAAAATPDGVVTQLSAAKLGIRRLGGIEQLSALRSLDLGGNPLASVAELASNTRLRRLILHDTGLVSLRGLAGLAQLELLDLSGAGVVELDELAGLPLRSLDLRYCPATALQPLASLTRLESLALGGVTPGGPGVTAIRSLSSLRQLRLLRLRLSSATLLSELVALEELVLLGCKLRDLLREFPNLPRLELLELSDCEVPDLRAIAASPSLRVLRLADTELDSLEPLRACPTLEQLDLRDAKFDHRTLPGLREHPRLRVFR